MGTESNRTYSKLIIELFRLSAKISSGTDSNMCWGFDRIAIFQALLMFSSCFSELSKLAATPVNCYVCFKVNIHYKSFDDEAV